jgi:PAS domain S-box-containing protein
LHPQFYEASLTIFLALSLGIYTVVSGERGHARRLFLALLGSIVLWSGGVALSRSLSDPLAIAIAVRLSFVGIFILPPVWYALALRLTRRGDDLLARGAVALLATPSLLAFAAMASNPLHHLYIRDPEILVATSPLEWAGPLFWIWVSWSYLLVFGASIRYLGWSWQLVVNDARWRGALVCIASLLPLSANLSHLLGWTPPGHDFTPLLLGFATVLLFVADWRYHLLDTLPVARRDVIEQLRDGVLIADVQGVILDMNPAAERMLQAPLSKLIGKPIVRAVTALAVDRFELDEAVFSRTVVDMCTSAYGFETTVENFAGRLFEIRGSGVTDPDGEISGLYIIMRDITERSRFEEMQRDSRRAQTIASLAAGITHEVNNPLTYVRANISHVIEALSEKADKDDVSNEEMQSVLEEALEGANRIVTIVERVRRFTQTRGGERESVSIARIFEDAARIRTPAPGPPIDLRTEVASDLRPAVGFHDGLLEAVVNLLDNAQNALRKTGGVIQLKACEQERGIRIEVEDDGPGVPEDLRGQIFEPFFTTGSNERGTGLGLSISAKLIADFGGTLTCEPVATGGARFVIELPDGSRSRSGSRPDA